MEPKPSRRDVTRRWVAFALLASFGCTTVVPARPPLSSNKLAEIEHVLRDGDADLTYVPRDGGGEAREVASEVTVAPDAVSWVRWESSLARSRGSPPGQRVEAPIESVRKIEICEPGCSARGALVGAGLGLVSGVAITGIVVASGGKPGEGGPPPAFFLIPGAAIGLLLGALIGSRGNPTVVDFERAPSEKR
jgi:hypothetical protein